MSREIKFRAWDKKSKKMLHEGFEVSASGDWTVYDDEDGGKSGLWEHDISRDYDLEIMQFTGLHDRNEREGYEDDIISRGFGKDHDIGVIEFVDGCFRIKWRKGDFSETLLYHLPEAEIIGNRWENPALLGGDKS